MPCLIVPPCRDLGLGTALRRISRAMPCPSARRPVGTVLARVVQVELELLEKKMRRLRALLEKNNHVLLIR